MKLKPKKYTQNFITKYILVTIDQMFDQKKVLYETFQNGLFL